MVDMQSSALDGRSKELAKAKTTTSTATLVWRQKAVASYLSGQTFATWTSRSVQSG